MDFHKNRVKQMELVQSEALSIFTKKNIDYGVLMRIEDKIQRSLSITKNCVNLVNPTIKLKDLLIINYYQKIYKLINS